MTKERDKKHVFCVFLIIASVTILPLIKLIFSGKKPVLSRWIIRDESGSATLMSIERYEENISLGEMQFNIQLEIERRRN